MASNMPYLDVFVKGSCGKQLKCSICECWLPAGAEKFGDNFFSSHINGRKHKQGLEKKKQQENKLQCSVYVKGFNPVLPHLEEELQSYFEKMDVKVKDIYIDKNTASYGIIEFMEKNDVDTVLGCDRLLFHDKKIIVKRREIQRKNIVDVPETGIEKTSDNSTSLLPKDLEDELKKTTDIVEQMKILMNFLELTPEELLLRNLICKLVENVLEELYPECKVVLFGSSANGLGEKGCDVDMTLIADGINDENTVCAEVREVIQRFAPGCKNVTVVQSTKTCSIVKFFHVESNLFVDLSMNNYLAIRNTELLKAYMSYDERVPLITSTVRKWSKCSGLSGRNNCQITQYSLTLMIIYYLQQIQPPVLPCLQECHPSSEDMVGQWDCSFCECEKSPKTNKLKSNDLLLGFFKFYTSFDFGKNVIAIHSSTMLSRHDVYKRVNSLNVGDAEEELKFSSSVVVQDPFKLSHNVSHNLSSSGITMLMDSLKKVTSLETNAESGIKSLTQLFQHEKKSSRQKQKRKRNRSNAYMISLPNCQHSCSASEVICFDKIKTILVEDLRMRLSDMNVEPKDAEIPLTLELPIKVSLDAVNPGSLKRTSDEVSCESSAAKRLKTEPAGINFIATAYADTWTNRRKQRRLIKKLQKGDDVDMEVVPEKIVEDADSGIIMSDASAPSSITSNLVIEEQSHALLDINIKVTKALNENQVCKLKLEPVDDSKNLKDFQTFYAYIKKELIAMFK